MAPSRAPRRVDGSTTPVLAALLVAMAATACVPGDETAAPVAREGVPIPLRDGVELVADVMLPAADGRHPTILEITPYGRGPEALNFRGEAGYWNRHGYAFAIVDSRGTGDSGGEFTFLRTSGRDGHDVVEWIAAREWSDGRVAMRGSSYSGTNQLHVAATRPPHLRCITPSATAWSPRRDLPYWNGALRFDWALTWPTQRAGAEQEPPGTVDWPALLDHRPLRTVDEVVFGSPQLLYRRFLEHPPTDRYWDALELGPDDYAAIEVPSLAFTGWFDGTLPGTVAHHRGLSRHSPATGRHFLIVGPWEHLTAPDGGHDYRTYEPVSRVGDLELPEHAFVHGLELTREFLDWCVRGIGGFEQPPERIYLTGSHRWLELHRYPPPEAELRPLYLQSAGPGEGPAGGSLAGSPPRDQPPDEYTFDPADPAPAPGLDGTAGPDLERPDGLAYLGEPLAASLSVAGPASLVLWAASDAPDTDFVASLEDVAPDGTARHLGTGLVRARYRHGLDVEEPLTAGEPTRFEILLGETGHTFLPGHRIRLRITSSAYPAVFPNPNTGGPVATDTAPPRTARQRIFHDRARPSRILLPVIPGPGEVDPAGPVEPPGP